MSDKLAIEDRRKDNWFKVDSLLLLGYGKVLGVYGIAVYNALAVHANRETHEAYPSYQTIADMIGCSRRKVIQTMEQLESLNIIRGEGRFNVKGAPMSNIWVLVDKEDWGEAGQDDRLLHEVVHRVHYPSESGALPSECDAPGSAHGAPKQESVNKSQLTNNIIINNAHVQKPEKPKPKTPTKQEQLGQLFGNNFLAGKPLDSEELLKQDLAKTIDQYTTPVVLETLREAIINRASCDRPLTWGYVKGILANQSKPEKERKTYASNSRRNQQSQAEQNRIANTTGAAATYYDVATGQIRDRSSGAIVRQ